MVFPDLQVVGNRSAFRSSTILPFHFARPPLTRVYLGLVGPLVKKLGLRHRSNLYFNVRVLEHTYNPTLFLGTYHEHA